MDEKQLTTIIRDEVRDVLLSDEFMEKFVESFLKTRVAFVDVTEYGNDSEEWKRELNAQQQMKS